MAGNNTIMIIGRAGSDAEVRTAGAHQVAKFNVAVNRNQKDRDGNYPTDWFGVELWGKQAEQAQRLVKKGDLLSVSGTCTIDSWTDKQGGKQTKVVVKGDGFQCLTPKTDNAGGKGNTDDKPFW